LGSSQLLKVASVQTEEQEVERLETSRRTVKKKKLKNSADHVNVPFHEIDAEDAEETWSTEALDGFTQIAELREGVMTMLGTDDQARVDILLKRVEELIIGADGPAEAEMQAVIAWAQERVQLQQSKEAPADDETPDMTRHPSRSQKPRQLPKHHQIINQLIATTSVDVDDAPKDLFSLFQVEASATPAEEPEEWKPPKKPKSKAPPQRGQNGVGFRPFRRSFTTAGLRAEDDDDENVEVIDCYQQCQLSWQDLPWTILNWLKFNIIQQEQAGLYCTPWRVSPLEHFDLSDKHREKLVRDFQIFLDETLMRPKPTKHEMRSKIRAKYRKEKFGRTRSESPPAPERMLETTGGFSGSDDPSKSSRSRQVSPGPEKPREVPIPPSLTEEQQQLALQLQTITAQGPFQEGMPSPHSLPSPRGGPWPEIPSYEFPLMVYSEQEKQKAWSDISTKLLRSLGFDIAEPEIGVDEKNMRNVEEVLGVKFPDGFEFSTWDQDPYCLQAAGILGLELPQSARSMPEGQVQAKRWQRRTAEPLPEPPPGQPATHQGVEILARVLEWSLRRTQRHFKRLAFKELRLRPALLDSPKADLSNTFSNTFSSLGLGGLPSPEKSSPRKARPLPMKGRPAGDPFPGAVPLPDSYNSLGVGKAPAPPGQATPRQGNWAASPKKSERLQANTALPPSTEEGYVGCIAWKYSQNSSPSAQVEIEDAEMTGTEHQEQRAANWASYLRTKDPAMLEEVGMAHGARTQDGFLTAPPGSKTPMTPRNLPPIGGARSLASTASRLTPPGSATRASPSGSGSQTSRRLSR